MTRAGIEPATFYSESGYTTTAALRTNSKYCEQMSYILLIASGLRFTGILVKIQQEIVYTVAFKVT